MKVSAEMSDRLLPIGTRSSLSFNNALIGFVSWRQSCSLLLSGSCARAVLWPTRDPDPSPPPPLSLSLPLFTRSLSLSLSLFHSLALSLSLVSSVKTIKKQSPRELAFTSCDLSANKVKVKGIARRIKE